MVQRIEKGKYLTKVVICLSKNKYSTLLILHSLILRKMKLKLLWTTGIIYLPKMMNQ